MARQYTEKICDHCYRKFKPNGAFQKWCSICIPDPLNYRARGLLKHYDMTEEEFNKLLEKQDFKCSIEGCTREPKVVDHSHACCPNRYTCGYCVRGILCSACNSALASLESELKENRINYLLEAVR
jgi:hypothetical protein